MIHFAIFHFNGSAIKIFFKRKSRLNKSEEASALKDRGVYGNEKMSFNVCLVQFCLYFTLYDDIYWSKVGHLLRQLFKKNFEKKNS